MEGLLRGLADDRKNEPEQIESWYDEGWPTLVACLERAGLAPHDAEDVASIVVERALTTSPAARDRVGCERAWLEGVARNALWQRRRAAEREAALEAGLIEVVRARADGTGEEEPHAWLQELREQLTEAIALLPPPYRQAAELQLLRGASRKEIHEVLTQWRPPPVSEERVRAILRQSHEMLRAWRAGDDPRTRWAQRYTRKNPWTSTPPPEI